MNILIAGATGNTACRTPLFGAWCATPPAGPRETAMPIDDDKDAPLREDMLRALSQSTPTQLRNEAAQTVAAFPFTWFLSKEA